MSNDKQIISIQIPTELYIKLKKTSEEEGTNVSSIIRKLILSYYKESK